MTEDSPPLSSRRIVVAVDNSPCGLAALEIATQWAACWQASVEGLFLEDERVLRAAALPFVQEISEVSASCRPLDVESLEKSWRSAAEQVGTLLEQLAHQQRLPWRYSVRRSELRMIITEFQRTADLAIVGRRTLRPTTLSRVHKAAPQASSRIVLLEEEPKQVEQILDVCQRLPRASLSEVIWVRDQAAPDDLGKFQQRLADAAATAGEPPLRLRVLETRLGADLPRIVGTQSAKLLLISTRHPLFDINHLEWLVMSVECPVGLLW